MGIASRQGLADYCLRRLGFPVIEINIDDDQISDRLDDALQYWYEYHFDGRQRVFITHQLTASTLKLANILTGNYIVGETLTGNTSGATTVIHSIASANNFSVKNTKGTFTAGETVTGSKSGYTAALSGTAHFVSGDIDNQFIPVGEGVLSITRMFNFGSGANSSSGNNIFDFMYQFRMNDMHNLLGADMTYYTMVKSHLTTLEQLLVSERQIRFNRKMNRIHVDTAWNTTFDVGDYVAFDGYAIVDPDEFSEVYDDMFLKKYATALIKKQWGDNMKKFNGIQLPGGVTMNGQQIYDEAVEEIDKIEADMQLKYELPPTFMVG